MNAARLVLAGHILISRIFFGGAVWFAPNGELLGTGL